MGYGAQPNPPPNPQTEQKTEEALRDEILERDSIRKCAGMGMGNHITAWNALKKLSHTKHPVHHAALRRMGYSVFPVAGYCYQIISDCIRLCQNLIIFSRVCETIRGGGR